MPTIAVYTAIFGGYEKLREPPPGMRCDFICFTDDRSLISPRYQIRLCRRAQQNLAKESRFYKTLSHRVLPEYDFTLWVDGSAELLFRDVELFAAEHLREHEIAVHEHPENDDVYSEFERCLRFKRDDPEVMAAQIAQYRSEGFPEKSGLVATGAVLRANRSAAVARFNEAWWAEISRKSSRDQLSFDYVSWREKIPYATFDKMLANPDGFHSRYFRFDYSNRPSGNDAGSNPATLLSYEAAGAEFATQTYPEIRGSLKEWLDDTLRLLPPQPKIFEIGSGTGRDAAYIGTKGYPIACSDGAQSMVDALLRKGMQARKFNVLTDEFEESYDLILANTVLLHFSDHECSIVLGRIHAALRPEGLFALSMKDGEGMCWEEQKGMPPRFMRYWKADELRSFLQQHGFAILSLVTNAPNEGDILRHRLICRKR